MGESGLGGKIVCGSCCRPIIDRYIMRIADMSYHERCLLCSICHAPLSHTCFIRDSKLFCRHDYDRLYVKRCLGCSERIGPEELVMRAVDSVFHLRCFLCVVCGVRLQKGDQYVVKQGQLFCRPDYEKEVEMFQGYAQGEYGCEELGAAPRSQDGRRGPKRPRTILTSQQRRAFKASFEISPKPCRKVREGLAKDTGLSVRIVQVWFQNQRAKMKKMQKKAKNNNNKDIDSMDEKPDKLKEEDHSSQGGGGFLNDSCSDTEGGGGVGGGLHMGESFHREYLPVKEESESEETAFYKNMLADQHAHPARQFINPDGAVKTELIGGAGAECLWATEAVTGAGGGPPLFLDQPPPQQATLHVNPIDRLYSMQNSYFCAEDNALMGQ